MSAPRRRKASAVGLQRPLVTLCFPAYNEEATLADVIGEALTVMPQLGAAYEIIVCDDCSTDRTPEILAALAHDASELKLVTHGRNLGIRDTFEDLYAQASGEYVFLNATDGQWPTHILLDMLAEIGDLDVLVASRRQKYYSVYRSLVSWAQNAACRYLFGVEPYDAGAVKLYRREVVKTIIPRSRSPFAEAERLVLAARAGYRIGNHPVDVQPRRHGRSGIRPRVVLQALLDLAGLWWRIHGLGERPVAARAA